MSKWKFWKKVTETKRKKVYWRLHSECPTCGRQDIKDTYATTLDHFFDVGGGFQIKVGGDNRE